MEKLKTPEFFVQLSLPELLAKYDDDYVDALLHVKEQLETLSLRQYTSIVRQQLTMQYNYLATVLNKQDKKVKYKLITCE